MAEVVVVWIQDLQLLGYLVFLTSHSSLLSMAQDQISLWTWGSLFLERAGWGALKYLKYWSFKADSPHFLFSFPPLFDLVPY